MTATLQQIRQDIRDRIVEPKARFWDDNMLNRWINEGCRDIARRAEVIQSFYDSIPVLVGAQKISLPSDVLRIHRVEFTVDQGSQVYPLELTNHQQMDQLWGTNQTTQRSTPSYCVIWGFPPNLTLQLYPVPAQNGKLGLYYYRNPNDMEQNSDVAEIPEGWHDAIALYVEYVARRRDRDPTWTEAKELYEQTLSHMIDTTREWHDQARTIISGPRAVPGWLYEMED